MDNTSKKKAVLGGACGLAAVVLLGGTFAWFTAQDSVINHLETDNAIDDSIHLVEDFTPPTDWKPGEVVPKKAWVVNDNSGDAVVRVKFSEAAKALDLASFKCSATAADIAVAQTVNPSAYSAWTDARVASWTLTNIPDNVKVSVRKSVADTVEVVAWVDGTNQKVKLDNLTVDWDKTTLSAAQATDVTYCGYGAKKTPSIDWTTAPSPVSTAIGHSQLTDLELVKIAYGSNVITALDATPANNAGKWFYNAADGYFYYLGKVAAGSSTPLLLQSLTLDAAASNAYASLEYDLTLTMEALQADEAAITGAWGLSAGALLDNLKTAVVA